MARLRERTVFADRRLTVTVLESLELQTNRSNHRRFLIGSLKPIAVVVREPDRTYAYDIESGVPGSK